MHTSGLIQLVSKRTNSQSGITTYQILLPLGLKLRRGHCRDMTFLHCHISFSLQNQSLFYKKACKNLQMRTQIFLIVETLLNEKKNKKNWCHAVLAAIVLAGKEMIWCQELVTAMKDDCINATVVLYLSITLLLKKVSDKTLGLVLLKINFNIFWFPPSKYSVLYAKCGVLFGVGWAGVFVCFCCWFSVKGAPICNEYDFCLRAWIANYKIDILRCLANFPYHPKLCLLAYLTWQTNTESFTRCT